MGKSQVELDFLGLHNLSNSLLLHPQPRFHRRDISKMNPEVVKSVIASYNHENASNSSSLLGVAQLPVFQTHPCSRIDDNLEKAGETGPMTIFYNGSISVFDLPKQQAEYIIKLAMENNDGHSSFNSQTTDNVFGSLNDGDMPIKRKKSLQRFFEKRKKRLISVSPYGYT